MVYEPPIDRPFEKFDAMTSVTLSSKFQLSIAKAVREELHLRAGQNFAVITKDQIISLVPIPDLVGMRGIAKGADTSNYRG